MITIFRRTFILIALLALGYIWLDGAGASGGKAVDEKQGKQWSLDERRDRLDKTVAQRWNARTTGDWVTVYELFSPDFRERSSLADYMQNKDKFYFRNWTIRDIRIEENGADVKIQYDWGLNLNMKIDLGKPFKEDVIIVERYDFDRKTGDWYFKENVLEKKRS